MADRGKSQKVSFEEYVEKGGIPSSISSQDLEEEIQEERYSEEYEGEEFLEEEEVPQHEEEENVDVWDDSALISAWDKAWKEYQAHHSIKATEKATSGSNDDNDHDKNKKITGLRPNDNKKKKSGESIRAVKNIEEANSTIKSSPIYGSGPRKPQNEKIDQNKTERTSGAATSTVEQRDDKGTLPTKTKSVETSKVESEFNSNPLPSHLHGYTTQPHWEFYQQHTHYSPYYQPPTHGGNKFEDESDKTGEPSSSVPGEKADSQQGDNINYTSVRTEGNEYNSAEASGYNAHPPSASQHVPPWYGPNSSYGLYPPPGPPYHYYPYTAPQPRSDYDYSYYNSSQRPPTAVPPMLGPDDDALANLLMSWYFSGYYTGLYQAKRRQG
ncbi:hypothetical protein G9A89_011794 [Geosiphon pyriformis]|nr:hypothetical protein G9A89_011794 [Geosiphon pyriformis]